MEILKTKSGRFPENENKSESFVTVRKANDVLSVNNDYMDDLKVLFKTEGEESTPIQVGNAKSLLQSLSELDSQCEKVDIKSEVKDVKLDKMLEKDKALFSVFNVTEPSILMRNKSDILPVETRYSAKTDLLDYYNLCKFANYCRDKEYKDLLDRIRLYLDQKNINNKDSRMLRLVYSFEDQKYYLRAITSIDRYKDYGINFSVYVALMSLHRYAISTNQQVYIDRYQVNESEIIVSFTMGSVIKLKNPKLSLSFNLILENDEVKQQAVSYSGVYKLTYTKDEKNVSSIYLKPSSFRRSDEISYSSELLSYSHSLNVKTVYEKIQGLPDAITYFIQYVSNLSEKLTDIKEPEELKQYIVKKIKKGNKEEFKQYKNQVIKQLVDIKVNTTFELFQTLGKVEAIFNEDVLSLNYWRSKLYDIIIRDVNKQ